VNLLKPYLFGTNSTVMTDCKVLLTLKGKADFKSRLMRWHLALQQFIFGIHHVKEEDLSRIDLSDLESKSLEYSLESNFDACGSGLFSIYFTEKQEAEAKELYRVLFLVLQDLDALKTLSFDKVTKKKVRSMFVWEKMAPRFS